MKSLILSLLCSLSLFAGMQNGQYFPKTVFPDQFGNEQSVTADDRIVLLSFEKDVSVAINDYLKTKPKDFVYRHRVKYISDISPMPSVITRMFALPKMRDYKYPVLLIYDDAGSKYDKQEGKITVYRLEKGVLQSTEFITPDALPKLFGES